MPVLAVSEKIKRHSRQEILMAYSLPKTDHPATLMWCCQQIIWLGKLAQSCQRQSHCQVRNRTIWKHRKALRSIAFVLFCFCNACIILSIFAKDSCSQNFVQKFESKKMWSFTKMKRASLVRGDRAWCTFFYNNSKNIYGTVCSSIQSFQTFILVFFTKNSRFSRAK